MPAESSSRMRNWQRITLALFVVGYAGYYRCRAHFPSPARFHASTWPGLSIGCCNRPDGRHDQNGIPLVLLPDLWRRDGNQSRSYLFRDSLLRLFLGNLIHRSMRFRPNILPRSRRPPLRAWAFKEDPCRSRRPPNLSVTRSSKRRSRFDAETMPQKRIDAMFPIWNTIRICI